jgi:putative FmdB family regulatory protein
VPFYEYQCYQCGEVHEAFQKMSDPPLETCEKCGGKLRKLLHPVAVHFKGSGFYATDYRKKEKHGDNGWDALDRERYKRAEQGDPVAQRVVESESKPSSSSSGSDSKSKETQKAT